MKPWKIVSIWGPGPGNYIWASCARKMYQAITPEPYHQFPHTGPHFIQNHKLLSLKLWNLESFLSIWGLGDTNYIWATSAQKMYQAITPEHYHQFSHTGPDFIQNHNLLSLKLWSLEKLCQFVIWGLETTFGPLGPKRHIKP